MGHTHADVDALIGTIVSYLRNVDQMAPSEFAKVVGEACKSNDGSIDSIENTLATPDYESYFGQCKLRSDFEGVTECREIRLTNDDSDDSVKMYYKVLIYNRTNTRAYHKVNRRLHQTKPDGFPDQRL